jgi:tRNA threonylcarbamoyladenosine biosynthesis protein TsaE
MPILDPHSFEFISRSTEQTRRLGMRLGALLKCGDVVLLAGELGSGKTTLAQGIAAGWGSMDTVTSPSFVLINVYRGPDEQRMYHLDAYRLESAREAAELDIEPMVENGLLVVEWADRIGEVLPAEHLWIKMRWIDDDQRDLVLAARGERYERILATIRKQLFGIT